MKKIQNRLISVNESGINIFLERRLNNNSQIDDDIRIIANRFENSFNNVEIYDIEFNPKDLENGYFCAVEFCVQYGDVTLLETPFKDATYENSLQRLKLINSAGFVVKVNPTKHCIFSIDNNSNKTIVLKGLTRTEAKSKVKELNETDSSIEFDYEIEEDFINTIK